MPAPRLVLRLLAACLLLAGCGSGDDELSGSPTAPPPASPPVSAPSPTSEPEGDPAPPPALAPDAGEREDETGLTRPAWLGTRPLPVGPDGFAEAQPTPPELEDRRLPPPPSDLPAPDGEGFDATVEPVPPSVLARSTWSEACPVEVGDLRYLTMTFWGFDDANHTGELLVNAAVADDVVEVFRRLHDARFPIEEMRVIRADELDLEPTGDGNVTTAFVCRDSRGTTSWSEHAHGLAVDINPFHNPYRKGEVVLPELATTYVDRDRDRPGMIQPGDVVTRAFADIGWGWGGDWSSLKDWMHFSRSGR